MNVVERSFVIPGSEFAEVWASELPWEEKVAADARLSHRRRPANENGPLDWSASVRDHSPDDLDDWLDGVEAPPRAIGPMGLRLVSSRND